MEYWKIPTVMILCVSMMIFPSCQKKSVSPSEQTIYYRVTDEPVTLDPQIADDNPSRLVIMNIFEGLTRLDENDNAVEGVADRWKADISKMEYTFHIRDNAKWSDGSRLTAQDFVYGFQRLFSSKTGSSTAKELFCIKNSEKVRNDKLDMSELGVYAENENTLKIQLEYLDPQFTALLAQPCAMPCKKDFFESTGGQYGLESDKILSNGCFRVGDNGWQHEKYIDLVRNSNYAGKNKPVPKGVSIEISESPENVSNAILNGEIDCYRTDMSEYEQAKKNKLNVTSFSDTVWGIAFNTQSEIFGNKDIRVSMLKALDRKEILSDLPEGCRLTEDIVPETAKAGTVTYREFVGRGMGLQFSGNAQAEFEKALEKPEHEDEYDYWYDYEEIEFPVLNILCTDEEEIQGVVNGMIREWNQLTGDYANKTPVSREELEKRVLSGEYDIAIVPLKPDGASPVDTLKLFSGSSEYNVSHFHDEKYDKIIADILAKPDSTAVDKMVQAEKYLHENGIFYPLYTEDRYYISGVKNIIFHPYGAEADFSSAEKIQD